jgi:leucyl aminopeptidase (aminopeptidase T)
MANNKIIDAIKSAEFIVHKLLGVKAGEEVVVVGDPDTDIEMMQALAGVIQGSGAEYNLVIMPNRPPESSLTMTRFIEKGLEAADVLIGLTKSSGATCYSAVVERLRKEKGLRQLSMVMRDLDILTKGGATADYEAMMLEAVRLKEAWSGARRIHLTSPAGTDLKMDMVFYDGTVETDKGLLLKDGRLAL